MKQNIGMPDRIIRLAVAVILLGFSYSMGSWLLLLAGGFVLFEAAFSWCVVYQILGKNSCPRK